MIPKVKFLTVVWGASYIERFANLALPSFLAPGNLPALAAQCDLEYVVLTSAKDIGAFEEHQTFKRLRAVCPIRFITIDDLITSGVYGVTLTLAYGRGVMASGPEMVNTHFIFMNADFVLADGSLRSLAKPIAEGRPVVVAGSFRAVAEDVEPTLLAMVDPATQTLAMKPRDMVALSLRHVHPTTIAKTVNQNLCHTVHPNQLFWRIDDNTILGRYYLIFMLCLKPERVITHINSYCDYGFIPEMCPTAEMVALTDSDDFFMLEMQGRTQESNLLRLGQLPAKDVALSLSGWTTKEHRDAAKFDLVFHAREMPTCVASAKAAANKFVGEIESHMGPPASHRHHYYWVSGVDAWHRLRRWQRVVDLPAEIEPEAPESPAESGWWPQLASAFTGRKIRSSQRHRKPHLVLIDFVRPWLVGTPPDLRFWHPAWSDYHEFARRLRPICENRDARILIVTENVGFFSNVLMPDDPRVNFVELSAAMGEDLGKLAKGTFTHGICYVLRKDVRRVREIYERLLPLMAPQAEMLIFIQHTSGMFDYSNFSSEMMDYISFIMPGEYRTVEATFGGGMIKRQIYHWIDGLMWLYIRFGVWVLPLVGPVLLVIIALSALCNLVRMFRRRQDNYITHCSSILLRIKP